MRKKISFSVFQNGQKISDQTLLSKVLKNFSTRQPQTEDIFQPGLFESLRVYRGKIFQEEGHLERLRRSAKTAGFTHEICPGQIREELRRAVKAFREEWGTQKAGENIFVRLTLWGGQVFVMVGSRKSSKAFSQKGVRLQTSPVRQSLFRASPPEIKSSAYQNSLLANLEPAREKIFERIFLDQNGFVTETSIGNFFMIRHEKIFTPPGCGILNGLTRGFVIKCAIKAGMSVVEIPLSRHEVFNAEEAFLTNTSWEILPVSELDGRRIGKRVPGAVTVKLQHIFNQKVEQEFL